MNVTINSIINSIKATSKNLLHKESKIWLLFWRFMGAVMFFGLTIIMTNNLDKNVYGAFEYGRTSLTLLSSLVLFGTDRSILQLFGFLESQNAGGDIFLVYKKMVSMLLIFCCIVLAIYVIMPSSIWIQVFADYQGYFIILKVTLSLFFYSITILNTEYFRVLNKMVLSELFRGVFKFLTLLLVVLYVFMYEDYQYLFDLYLIGFVLQALVTTFLVYRLKKPLSQKHHIDRLSIFKKSYPMAISSLGFLLLTTIDIYFLKKYSNLEQIAIYAIPVKVTMLLVMVITTFQAAVATEISTLFHKKEILGLQKQLKRTTNIIFLITLPILLGAYIFDEFILGFFGTSFTNGKTALDILLLGFLFSTFSSLSPTYFNMTGKEKVLQRIILMTVVLNIILNFILIPKHGIIGAAIASSICMGFWTFITLVYAYRKDGIKLFAHI